MELGYNGDPIAITSQNGRFGRFMVGVVEAEGAWGLRPLIWRLDLFTGELKLGVPGRLGMGEETLFEGPAITDPGRAKRDGDLPGPPGGSGEDDRGGGRGLVPSYLF